VTLYEIQNIDWGGTVTSTDTRHRDSSTSCLVGEKVAVRVAEVKVATSGNPSIEKGVWSVTVIPRYFGMVGDAFWGLKLKMPCCWRHPV